MGKLNIFAVVVGVFVVALMIGRYWNLKPESKYDHVVNPGEIAVAEGHGGPIIWVAAKAEMTYDLHAATAKGDQVMLNRAEAAKEAFPLEAGARVRVTGDSGSKRKVEVTSGPHTGQSGWVEFECLRPLARGEQ